MIKSVLVASAMLVALCSAAAARNVVHHPRAVSEAAMMSETHSNSFDFAAPTEDAGHDTHQYHGGPKAND